MSDEYEIRSGDGTLVRRFTHNDGDKRWVTLQAGETLIPLIHVNGKGDRTAQWLAEQQRPHAHKWDHPVINILTGEKMNFICDCGVDMLSDSDPAPIEYKNDAFVMPWLRIYFVLCGFIALAYLSFVLKGA